MPAAARLSADPRAAGVRYPDPLVTASVYADRQLDAVLLGGVVPWWTAVAAEVEARGGYLWTVRYSRRGDHLKLRLHAPPELEARLRATAGEAIARCLAALPALDGARRIRTDVPAIDAEDEGDDAQPDRTLVWTRYRRSQVSLGAEPWLDDDRYAACETAVLGAGFGLLAAAVPEVAGGEIPHRVRQSTLLKAVITGLAALGLGARAGDYLAYHRDWLLRFFVGDRGREAEFLARLDQRVAATPATVERLRAVAAANWSPADGHGDEAADHVAWRAAAARLAAYVGGFRDRPQYLTDPFADDPLFPAAFKALHGTANQLGLPPTEEAFVHHLLWHAGSAERCAPAARAEAVAP